MLVCIWPRLHCSVSEDFVSLQLHAVPVTKQRQRATTRHRDSVRIRMSTRTHKPFPRVLSCQASSIVHDIRGVLHGFCVIYIPRG
jgi:hypothetical protein